MEASTLRPSSPTVPTAGQTTTRSAAETRDVGRRLGAAAFPGTLLALHGALGAGKTELAKGVADGLGVRSVVNSPTFILMNEHLGRLRLFHVDAYRLTDPDEARAAGLLDERQADGVTVIEWAERLDGRLPGDRLELTLEAPHPGSDERVLRWRVVGARHARLATALAR
jgi:tRNA threonylcarbamoyladenosine biosynthesis protein TsaE